SFFFHPKPVQRVTPDRAERTHVGIFDTVKQPQKKARALAGEDLLEIHAARLALSARPRADHEILFSFHDGSDELRHQLRAIAAVAIKKNHDRRLRRERANPRGTGAAVTGRGF